MLTYDFTRPYILAQSWLYEEEIFSSFSATWWSPTAAHLAYFISDETLVTVMGMRVRENPFVCVFVKFSYNEVLFVFLQSYMLLNNFYFKNRNPSLL